MRATLALLFGPLVWLIHLAVLYGTHSSVCAAAGRTNGPLTPLIPVFALATAIALLLASLPLAIPARFETFFFGSRSEQERRFLMSVMRWLAGLSIVAVIANGIAVMIVPPC
ncbi:hypothetical protein [Reyranella sp.]|uniref:hypothetical protein n=1 Tax=Reyranella sp. TaxID=1929291 RepID=UPI003BAB8545